MSQREVVLTKKDTVVVDTLETITTLPIKTTTVETRREMITNHQDMRRAVVETEDTSHHQLGKKETVVIAANVIEGTYHLPINLTTLPPIDPMIKVTIETNTRHSHNHKTTHQVAIKVVTVKRGVTPKLSRL